VVLLGMQDLIRRRPGVISTRRGIPQAATSQTRRTGITEHMERSRSSSIPNQTSYRDILEFFFQIHDPTT